MGIDDVGERVERVESRSKTYLYTAFLELNAQNISSSLKSAFNSPLYKEGEAPKPKFEVHQISELTLIRVTGRYLCWQIVRRP